MIVFYISGHGFGHASRDIETIDALAGRAPHVRVQVRTAAPRWLFDLTARSPLDVRAVECDTGIAQIDSLRLDAAESIRRAAAFHRDLDRRAAGEARALEASGAQLVVGDVPPLAFAAAARAGVPAFALANFTWDWIYEDYPEVASAPDLVPAIRGAYAAARGAWRLPMCGGFESFPHVTDVPLVARRSSRDPRDVRRRFDLPLEAPVVLASFGGVGLPGLPLDHVDCLDHCSLLAAEPFPARSHPEHPEHVVQIDERQLYASGYRYEDLVRAADVVVTKPGYGIIAECAANDAAIVYTSRGRFREYDVLVREMPRFVRCEFLPQDDLLAGRWGDAIERALAQPRPARPRVDGADVVADLILGALGQSTRDCT